MIRNLFRISIVMWLLAGGPLWAATLNDIRVDNGQREARVMLEFDGRPAYAFFPLQGPDRVVLDVRQTRRMMSGLPLNFSEQDLVRKIRTSAPKDNDSLRLVFELSSQAEIKAVTQQKGNRYTLVFTIMAEGGRRFAGSGSISGGSSHRPSSSSEVTTVSSKSSSAQVGKNPFRADSIPADQRRVVAQPTISKGRQRGGTIVIAIDAGHGGQDPGAIGPSGLQEKRVTLAIARKLKVKLEQDRLFKPAMTREGDYFISVMGRSDVARSKGANLLVSIHADAAPNRRATGASVWVLSNKRANNELGRWLEQHEKQSELLGGAGDVLANRAADPYLSQAVLDLQFGHSQRVGYDVAVQVLRQFGRISSLHKSTPEHASLGVLRSPDIPSLLVETGFISNHTEERLLSSDAYQAKVANAIYQGIRHYFLAHPLQAEPPVKSKEKGAKTPEKTLSPVRQLPQRTSSVMTRTRIHIVQRTETLTGIAASYGTTIQTLIELNQLKKQGVWVGQKLKVPVGQRQKSSSRAAAVTRYMVQRGDSLFSIAAKYGVSMVKLKQVNKLTSDNVILGQILTIPSS